MGRGTTSPREPPVETLSRYFTPGFLRAQMFALNGTSVGRMPCEVPCLGGGRGEERPLARPGAMPARGD